MTKAIARALVLASLLSLSSASQATALAEGYCGKDANGAGCPQSTTCVADKSGYDLCLHKKLFPLNTFDILAIVLVFFSCALAAGGGIGGGGLLVPIYIVVLNLPTSQATVSANANNVP